MIHECNCYSEFQDMTYGKGRRVFNPMKVSNQFRCSVCGRIVTVGSATVISKKNAKKAEEAVKSAEPVQGKKGKK